MTIVKIYTPSDARTTLLRRVQWEDQEMPAAVLDGIESIFGARMAPAEAVAHILRDVRARGDAALHEWAQRIDRRPQGALEVPAAEWRAAYERLPEEQRSALEMAAERIATFHRKQPMSSWVDTGPDGTLGQLIRPLDRAGVYVPGGTAPLPSSLLMAAIPARGRRGRSCRLHAGRERGHQRSDPGCGVRGESGSALRARRRAGDRRAGLRHRERASASIRSSARAGCS